MKPGSSRRVFAAALLVPLALAACDEKASPESAPAATTAAPTATATATATATSTETALETATVQSTTQIGAEISPAGDRWVLIKEAGCWSIESLTYNLEARP